MRKWWFLASLMLAACAPRQLPEEDMAFYQEALEARPVEAHNITRPSAEEPMQWEVGHWALSKHTDRRGRVSVQQMSVVAHDDCGWWVEIMELDQRQRSISKICYTEMPHADVDAVTERATDLVQVVITQVGDQEPTELDLRGPQGEMMRRMASGMLEDMAATMTWDVTDRRDTVEVQAGRFRDALVTEFDFRVLLTQVQGTSWVHSAVPVHGTVRTEMRNGATTELIDFGTRGGETALPDHGGS